MGALIDSSVWIDFFHPKTAPEVRRMAAAQITRPDAVLCEPVYAEIFHGMPDRQVGRVEEYLGTVPLLETPGTLWRDVIGVIRACTRKGNPVGTLDALIGVIALAHEAAIVTFDRDFLALQKHCGVRVELLERRGD